MAAEACPNCARPLCPPKISAPPVLLQPIYQPISEVHVQRRKKEVGWVGAIVAILMGCLAYVVTTQLQDRIKRAEEAQAQPLPPPALKLLEWEWETADSSRRIVGLVTNNSDKDFRHVGVTFGLYDDDGAKVGTTTDWIGGLASHQVWKFRAEVFRSGPLKASLEEITKY